MNLQEEYERHHQANLGAYVRLKLDAYLSGHMTLREFNRWLVPNTWNMEANGVSKDTINFVYEIDLRVAEYSYGHWTEDELKLRLREVLC